MEMPPPNEVSVVFYQSPGKYNYVDFCVRAVTRSKYTHCALRIGDWSLHIGHEFPAQWVLHSEWTHRWKPVAEVKVGDYIAHALEPRFTAYEGQLLSRIKCWFYGWFTIATKPSLRLPEPTTCVSITRDILNDHFGMNLTGTVPETLYKEMIHG